MYNLIVACLLGWICFLGSGNVGIMVVRKEEEQCSPAWGSRGDARAFAESGDLVGRRDRLVPAVGAKGQSQRQLKDTRPIQR